MCIFSPTKNGIKDLPECGVYYKVLWVWGDMEFSEFHGFEYPLGKTVNIPKNEQGVGNRAKTINAGGHFYRNYKDALHWCDFNLRVAKFRIYRKHIDYIGYSWNNKKCTTILAHKARRIK